jgi:hypothetical protein
MDSQDGDPAGQAVNEKTRLHEHALREFKLG